LLSLPGSEESFFRDMLARAVHGQQEGERDPSRLLHPAGYIRTVLFPSETISS
jgi:hypothetical protein